MNKNEFKGKTIVITGANGGIGFGIAKAFAEVGANLAIVDIISCEKSAVKLEDEFNVSVLPIQADGSIEKEVKMAINKVKRYFGRIDCIINAAQASNAGKSFIDHEKEDLDLAINSGLYATFFYMKEGFPYLKESKGSVINFASGAGLFGQAGHSSYAAAKEAIRGMSRVVATEWGKYGINVNVICPLAMSERLSQWKVDYPELYNNTIKDIPLNRFGDSKNDIGRVCVFLASDDASYITGDTINLQGGAGLRP